jgi:hypothetical protein
MVTLFFNRPNSLTTITSMQMRRRQSNRIRRRLSWFLSLNMMLMHRKRRTSTRYRKSMIPHLFHTSLNVSEHIIRPFEHFLQPASFRVQLMVVAFKFRKRRNTVVTTASRVRNLVHFSNVALRGRRRCSRRVYLKMRSAITRCGWDSW